MPTESVHNERIANNGELHSVPEKYHDKLVSLGVSAQQAQMFYSTFLLFDADASGSIDASELYHCLQVAGQAPENQEEVNQMVSQSDSDRSGRLEFVDFANLMSRLWKPQAAVREQLVNSFRLFDTDQSGYLDRRELHDAIFGMGPVGLTEEEFDELARSVDTDGDGRIDYEEFCAILLSDINQLVETARAEMRNRQHHSRNSSGRSTHAHLKTQEIKHQEHQKQRSHPAAGHKKHRKGHKHRVKSSGSRETTGAADSAGEEGDAGSGFDEEESIGSEMQETESMKPEETFEKENSSKIHAVEKSSEHQQEEPPPEQHEVEPQPKSKQQEEEQLSDTEQNEEESPPEQNEEDSPPEKNEEDSPPEQNEEDSPPEQNEEEPSPEQNEEDSPPEQNVEEPSPEQNEEESPPEQNEEDSPPEQNEEDSPPEQHKESPPQQLAEPPPEQHKESPPQQLAEPPHDQQVEIQE